MDKSWLSPLKIFTRQNDWEKPIHIKIVYLNAYNGIYMLSCRCVSRRRQIIINHMKGWAIMKEQCKHGEWYTVKRLRLLDYLCNEKHMYPEYQTPDPTNPRYSWYVYKNTPELEKNLDEYFRKLKQNA